MDGRRQSAATWRIMKCIRLRCLKLAFVPSIHEKGGFSPFFLAQHASSDSQIFSSKIAMAIAWISSYVLQKGGAGLEREICEVIQALQAQPAPYKN
jgi:hypothetical protein